MRMKISLLLFLCLSVILLAGCGYNGAVGNTGQNSATFAPTVTAVPRITPGLHPTVTPTPTHTSSSGQVVVQLSALTYQPGATIAVTIINRTSQRIVFADHQSDCSVVLLQHQTALSWEPVALCKLMIVTRLHGLAAGASQAVSLKAPSTPTGAYRIVFSYSGGPSPSRGSLLAAYSPLFQVR
jgi:hypothetical protein